MNKGGKEYLGARTVESRSQYQVLPASFPTPSLYRISVTDHAQSFVHNTTKIYCAQSTDKQNHHALQRQMGGRRGRKDKMINKTAFRQGYMSKKLWNKCALSDRRND